MENMVNPCRCSCVFIAISRVLGLRLGRNILKLDYRKDGSRMLWDVFRLKIIIFPLEG